MQEKGKQVSQEHEHDSRETAPGRAGETPNERFRRLGNKRLAAALDAIAGLEKLAVGSAYDFGEREISVILSALGEAVSGLEYALRNRKLPPKGPLL